MALSARIAVVSLLLAAASARAVDDPRTLTYALAADVDSLDPAWAYDATSLFVIQQVYETLVGYDGASVERFEPLAASVVPSRENGFISKDGLTYTFPLRVGVKFHNGSILTPQDVKYSLMRFLLSDREGGPSSLLLEPLLGRHGIVGPDGKPDPAAFDAADRAVSIEGGALVLRLAKPFAPLLSVLAGYAPMVSRSFVTAHGGWDGSKETWTAHWNPAKQKSALFERANGTGPFRLEGWDREGKRLLLARHEDYWRKPAELSAVRLETIESPRERRRRLERGEADVAQIEQGHARDFADIAGVVVDPLPTLEVPDVVLFNLRVEPRDNPWLASGRLDGGGVPPDFFSEIELRKAFALSFDGDAYIREAYQGAAVRSRGPVPQGLPGYNPRQQPWPYSPEQAQTAFQRARGGTIWNNGFLLPLAYAEGRSDQRLACRLLQAGVARVNAKFRIDCRGIPQSRLLDELRARRLPALVFSWVLDYPDAHNAVEPFLHSRGHFAERLGYSNPRADALIEQAQTEPDAAKRKALYAELQALAFYDAPQIYTVEAPGALARRAKVQNWVFNPIEPYGSLYEVNKLP